jgi:hypothetical protein
MPSVLTPQVCLKPALTWLKVPAGGVACPKAFHPQQVRVPSVFTPQVCQPPALTWLKVPAGGVACP